ncbi:MAG TPA: DNA alkylation repair protein [archaeon]|nr:DNA alkylation repair protein [archaeon]
MKTTKEIIKELKSFSEPEYLVMGEKFACPVENSWGVPIPYIRKLAREIGKDHELALELWKHRIREVKQLATLIDKPEKVTEKQMEFWVKAFDCWVLCDHVCMNLFDKTKFAEKKIFEWSKRKEEFVRRAAFVLIASLAVHDKSAKDSDFEKFFPLIKSAATDERNFVKKAVNWALRQIGKRNEDLRKSALKTAKEILKFDSKSARWIASDAIIELKKK